jgi:hypothetical protein
LGLEPTTLRLTATPLYRVPRLDPWS